LFATLAISFYTAVGTTAQMAQNDADIARAQVAAESGMDYARYALARVSIAPGATGSAVTNDLYGDLQTQLESTANLSGKTITLNNSVINLPHESTIALDAGGKTRFAVTITDWPDQGKVVVKSVGTFGQISRAIQMDFTRVPKKSSVFDYAVASKGQIVLNKGTVTTVDPANAPQATAMSALSGSNSAIIVNGGNLGGDLTVMDDSDAHIVKGSVAGESISAVIRAEHLNSVAEPPEFPTVDTSPYAQYATNSYVSGARTQQNIRIPAGTNPQFAGGDTVQGILYIESPNTVTFRGNFTLQGILVFETSANGENSTDKLDFRGNVSQTPLPSGSQFDSLRAASGVSILAPTSSVTMSGSTDSLLRGNLICNTFNFAGSADIVIDQGTLMTLKSASNSVVFSGKTVKFTATGADNVPTTGISFSRAYAPTPGSYEELTP
jgi:hypothetical protein